MVQAVLLNGTIVEIITLSLGRPAAMTIPIIPAAAGSLLIILALYHYVIHPAFISPLAKAPKVHWSSSISPAWILYHRLKQRDTLVVHDAHTRLGPVVRLAPDELSVNCVDGGIRSIYGNGFDKGDWYAVFNNYGVPPMFAMPDRNDHSKRKRMVSNVYAKSTLQNSEAVAQISQILLHGRLIGRLREVARSGKPVEVYDLFSSATMDVVAAYVFGLKNGSDFLRRPEYAKKFLEDYKARQEYTFWAQELPGFTKLMRRLGLLSPFVPRWVDEANLRLEDWLVAMCDKAEASLSQPAGEKTSPCDYPTVYALLRNGLLDDRLKIDKGASVQQLVLLDRLTVASEIADHVLAGFDTSSITLTWLAWELSKVENAAWQAKLRAEVAAAGVLDDLKAMDSLSILEAILMETLRLHAAIPGNQPRLAPENAVLGSTDHKCTGIPAGTRVQSQAWSLHRNPDVFPDPDAWKPDRWLESSPAQLKEMRRWFWAFGSGGRMCVGSNLAMLEMKAIVATIWAAFETKVVDDCGMIHNGGYLSEPLGKDGRFLVLGFKEL